MESFFLSETVSMCDHLNVTDRRCFPELGLHTVEDPISLDSEEIERKEILFEAFWADEFGDFIQPHQARSGNEVEGEQKASRQA
jgi:hypothetical protein